MDTCKRIKLKPFLAPQRKINSWIIDINVKANTVKLLEYIGMTLGDLGLGKTFLHIR